MSRRSRRHAQQAYLPAKSMPRFRLDLAAFHRHPAEAELVQHGACRRHACGSPTRFLVFVVKRTPKPGDERLLKRAGAERLELLRVERAEPPEQLVGGREVMIDTHAELIEVAVLLLRPMSGSGAARRRLGAARAASKAVAIGSMRLGRNLVVRERRANPRSSGSSADRRSVARPAKSPARDRRWWHGERPRQRAVHPQRLR